MGIIIWVTSFAAAGLPAFADLMPAHFVSKYGYPKSTRTIHESGFRLEGLGFLPVKREFGLREFRSGDLRVEAFFYVPSLKLAAADYYLPHFWTPAQLAAALAANGRDWKKLSGQIGITVWKSADGCKTFYSGPRLQIQAASIVEALKTEAVARDAKRKVVPKF